MKQAWRWGAHNAERGSPHRSGAQRGRRQDGFLTVYIVIPRGFVEMLASNGGEKLTDSLQLRRLGVQT